jgi:hypothetical protein
MGCIRRYKKMTLGREGLKLSLDNHLFPLRIGNGNSRGLRRHRHNSTCSPFPGDCFRQTCVAHLRFLSVSVALLQYVSRGQKSLECFRVQKPTR